MLSFLFSTQWKDTGHLDLILEKEAQSSLLPIKSNTGHLDLILEEESDAEFLLLDTMEGHWTLGLCLEKRNSAAFFFQDGNPSFILEEESDAELPFPTQWKDTGHLDLILEEESDAELPFLDTMEGHWTLGFDLGRRERS